MYVERKFIATSRVRALIMSLTFDRHGHGSAVATISYRRIFLVITAKFGYDCHTADRIKSFVFFTRRSDQKVKIIDGEQICINYKKIFYRISKILNELLKINY
jgi:hypothetical protein